MDLTEGRGCDLVIETAGSEITMAVYPCRLPEQAEELLKLAAADAAQRGADFDGAAYLREAEALLNRYPDRIALSYLKGQPSGFIRFDHLPELPDGDIAVQQLYVIPALQQKGYGEQLFGYACHVLRYQGQNRIVMRTDGTPEETRVASRFAMDDMHASPAAAPCTSTVPPVPTLF